MARSYDAAPAWASLVDQQGAIAVEAINAARLTDEAAQLALQEESLAKALGEMQKVRDFLGNPERILGNDQTKHGEIAEHVEVGVRRARDLLLGSEPGATFEGVGRTAPADYRIDGIDVQSKFINGTAKSLDHVLDHMGKYEQFGRDGSYYHIPADQHARILKVLDGDTQGLSARSVRAIQEKVAQIEAESGQPFHDVVKPSVSDYADVQQGKVHDTVRSHEEDLRKENENLKERIAADHEASLAEGLKAAAAAGAVGAAAGFMSGAFRKYREGKNVFKGEFSAQDWKDVGGDALQGGIGGAVIGGAVYVLTNCAGMAAPFAGAFVSAAKGLKPLVDQYRAGRISLDALVDGGMLVCSDAALVGICTAAGQTLIPIPVLGAVVGSIAGKFLSSFLAGKVSAVQAAIKARLDAALARLDEQCRRLVAEVEREFERLGELTMAAFDLGHNVSLLQKSLDLARAHGVNESLLIKDNQDLDAFMLS